MALAILYSSRGTCDRLRVACVLVNNRRIVGAGYNGSVSGHPSCDEEGHLMVDGHCIRTIHSEDNAISNALMQSAVRGSTAYITARPCYSCTKKLLNSGVERIVYLDYYDNASEFERAEELCQLSNASFEKISGDPIDVLGIFADIFKRLEGQGGLFNGIDIVGTLETQLLV